MTPPKNVNVFPKQQFIANDCIQLTPDAKMKKEIFDSAIDNWNKNFKNQHFTEAGQTALQLADMEVDGEKAISKAKWDAFVADKFPHVTPKPIKNCIKVTEAMNSITTYSVKEQTAQKAEEKAALEAKSQEAGEDGGTPDMGI